MSVREVDHGWNRIKAELAKMNDAYVKVGIQTDAGEVEGVSIAQYGAWNEFGTENGHVPERSFMRADFDESRGQYYRILQNLMGDIWIGKHTANSALNLLGLKAVSNLQRKIKKGPFKKNADSTIRQKGSSKPLINEGTLRGSIAHKVVGA